MKRNIRFAIFEIFDAEYVHVLPKVERTQRPWRSVFFILARTGRETVDNTRHRIAKAAVFASKEQTLPHNMRERIDVVTLRLSMQHILGHINFLACPTISFQPL